MIGLGFIIRVVQFCFYFALAALLLWLIVFVISKVIKFAAHAIGYEIWDFGTWFFAKIKSMKKKKEVKVDDDTN